MNRFLVLSVVIISSFTLAATAAGSARPDRSVIGNGGGTVLDAQYVVTGTLGQPVIGALTGSNRVESGFWYILQRELSGLDDASPLPPREFSFDHPMPNPVSRFTRFRLAVPRSCRASVRLFDPGGRVIRTLFDKVMDPGVHVTTLDTFGLPCGIYFCRAEAEGFAQTRRLVLLHSETRIARRPSLSATPIGGR